MVLLVGPNQDGIQKLGSDNLQHIVLFEEVLKDLGDDFNAEHLLRVMREDADKVLAILKRPKNGVRTTKYFREVTGRSIV